MLNSFMLAASMMLGQSPEVVRPNLLPPAGGQVIFVQNKEVPKNAAVEKDAAASPSNGNGNGNGEEKKDEEEKKPEEKYFVMRTLEGTWLGQSLEARRITISGWIDQSYTGSQNKSGAIDPTNGTVVWNDRANYYLLQQAWVRLDKALDTDSKCINFGWHIDVIFGTDYRYTLPRGLWNSQLESSTPGQQNLYGVDPVQFYVNAWLPGIGEGTEVRLGRFFTPWGYESIEAVSSPFMSKSFAFNWSPPFTHTGVLAITKLSDQLTVKYGLTGGNDVFIDPSMRLNTVGAINYTTTDKKATHNFGWAIGSGRMVPDPFAPSTFGLMSEPAGRNNFNSYDYVYTRDLSDKWSAGFEAIYSHQWNVPANVPGGQIDPNRAVGQRGFAHWYALPVYLGYKATDKLKLQGRWEYFDDAEGQRTGVKTGYFAQTYGFVWNITNSIILRPEIRYDYSDAPNLLYQGRHDLVTGGADLIIRW